MQRKLVMTILLVVLTACNSVPGDDVATTTPTTTISLMATERPITLPPPYAGALHLVAADVSSSFCDLPSPFILPAEGVLHLSFLPNRKCDDINSDLDLFEVGGRLYVAQRNARGFRLVDVTDPTKPNEVGT